MCERGIECERKWEHGEREKRKTKGYRGIECGREIDRARNREEKRENERKIQKEKAYRRREI